MFGQILDPSQPLNDEQQCLIARMAHFSLCQRHQCLSNIPRQREPYISWSRHV